MRIAAVRDHAKHIILILLIKLPCLFIATSEQHLRSATHTQHLRLRVKRLGGEVQTLRKDIFIQVGQDGRIKPDIILH